MDEMKTDRGMDRQNKDRDRGRNRGRGRCTRQIKNGDRGRDIQMHKHNRDQGKVPMSSE
jgi:hypothetical protein